MQRKSQRAVCLHLYIFSLPFCKYFATRKTLVRCAEFLVNINYYYTHIAISRHETRDMRTRSTRQPSVFRDIDAGGNFASKLLEPLYNHHLAPNHSPLNHTPHTLNHSLYLLSPTYSSTPVPIHPLYYLLYVLYLCYSLLFITDYVPVPYFFLSTYNFNCQRLM